ncbi:hypothetical protein CHS0354_014193 [Potamilus streckersoni]|uniref:Macro domain-containing protein n=1 Tax=Potamilus streckersoni TaxID=2493646 RepID=A0AAE0SZ37_9BIVA|nr:hypothetical protein CHS0354_014193 [Potamilus streckersoni]
MNKTESSKQNSHSEVFSKLTYKTEDTVSKLKLPDPVELKDLNPQILKFLMKNKKHRQVFEKNLSDVYGVAIWPSSLEDCVIIKCTVKVEEKNASLLLKDWSIKVVDKVKNFTAGIEVAKFNLILIAWPKVLKELRASRVENPEDVMVFFEQDQYSIILTGSRGTMETLKKRVLDIIDMVIAQIKHEEQRITETKQMQTCAIILLMESNFKQEIKKLYPGLQFDLNLKEKNAIFVGQADIVQKAVVQMHGKLQSFVSRSMQMSKPARDLLFVKEITDYIKQKMKSQKIIGVWDLAVKNEIQMFAWDERDVQKAIQIVSNCLLEKEIILDDVMAQNVKGQPWLQLVQRIQEKHKQKVAIETSMKSILIAARDDIFINVSNEINGYLEKHVKELVLELGLVKMKYIKRYKMEDIKALEKKFESLNVKLFIIDYGDQQGIKIKGTMDGCNALETALTDINVITKEHAMVSKDGLKELFQSSRGREELRLIEGRWKCLIELKNSGTSVSIQAEDASDGCSSGSEYDADEFNEPTDWQLSSDICGTSIDACGIKVSFLEGELAKQRVDVIVNSTNQKLDLSIGAVSKAILKYGGDNIQKECLQQYPNGINPGKIVVTSGGNLSSKKVYHGYLKAYDHGKSKSLKLMRTFVKNCLKEADKSGFHSMAFPYIGTGKLGFPADKVGKLLVQCIEKFGKKTPKTSLKEIALVVFPSDTKNIKAEDTAKPHVVHEDSTAEDTAKPHVVHEDSTAEDTAKPHVVHEDSTAEDTAKPHVVHEDSTAEDTSKPQVHISSYPENTSCMFMKTVRLNDTIEPYFTEGSLAEDTFKPPICDGSETEKTTKPQHNGIYKCTLYDSVVLEIIQGDITKEMTDVIVNSVLPDFSLNQGNVSKAILKAGGISIQQECLGKVQDFEKDGFVVTKAGNLPCKMIIHIAVQNKRKEWENIIRPVLRHADRLRLNSISFPALGTGGKVLSPKKIAKAIYSACTDFAKSQPVCLKKIRVVLFKTKMLTEFVQTIGYCRSSQEETTLSEHPVDRTKVMEKSDPISLIFSISTDSESNFKAAVEDIEGFVKNELTEKEIYSPREIIAKLVDKQVTEMKGMGQGQAMVSVSRKKGVIKVSGTQREVLDTYENIMKYLRNIERGKIKKEYEKVKEQICFIAILSRNFMR